jgi:Na+/proline symporter
MNWFLSVINFIVLLGIAIYYAVNRNASQKIGPGSYLLSGVIVLFPIEYLLFLVWLGNIKSIVAIELAMLASIPIAGYLRRIRKEETAPQSLPRELINEDSNLFKSLYLAVYLLIKLVLVLVAAVFVLKTFLHWQSLSPLIVIILIVALYTAFGKFKALVMTQSLQAILCGSTLILFLVMGDTVTFGNSDSIHIALWKLVTFAFLYGIWQLTFEQQFYNLRQVVASRGWKSYFPLFLKFVLVILFMLFFTRNSQNTSGALLMTDSLPQWSNNLIQLGFLALIMGSLASVFYTIGHLFVRDFYTNEKGNESSWESDLIRKLIITLVAFFTVILVLMVKNAQLDHLMIIFGFWFTFSVTTVVLMISRRILNYHKVVVFISYGIGLGLNLVKNFISTSVFEKGSYGLITWFNHLNIFAISLIAAGLTGVTIFISQLAVILLSNKKISHEIKINK